MAVSLIVTAAWLLTTTPAAASPVSPVRQIDGSLTTQSQAIDSIVWPSIDGSGNNLGDPQMGAADTPLRRQLPSAYADGQQTLAGPSRPSARVVSNQINAQPADAPSHARMSDFLWQWGQFLDHDIDLTDGMDPPEPAPIAVPAGDPQFDPGATGTETISFNRSLHDAGTPRQQLNEITSWIDGSQIYGSDPARAAALRTNDGSGRLRTSAGDLLPINTDNLPNATGGRDPLTLFLAGDVRANEQVGLTVLHALFVREHNRLTAAYAAAQPELDGETLYQLARRWVTAELQVITYQEYLPALLGAGALPAYSGYNPAVDAQISNLFSTAAYRYGHSALSDRLLRLDAGFRPLPAGPLALRDAFFAPTPLTEFGLEPYLRGLAWQKCRPIDVMVSDEVRNFLFGPPGAGGFDLAALNIQRGRDHGLPDYNSVRVGLGLAAAATFADITSDPDLAARLATVYNTVNDVDAWVGGLAEDSHQDAMVGELVFEVLVDQFTRLRDGDRFWYQNQFSDVEIAQVEAVTLADVIRRNTDIGDELADNVFVSPLIFIGGFE